LLLVRGAGAATAATGSIWQVVPSANSEANQVTNSSFGSVSMRSATDGWAAGQFMDANALDNPLVEHWDGSRWTQVSAPEPSLVKTPNTNPHGEGSLLSGIAALRANDIWAVGQTQDLNGAIRPLTQKFNGTAWTTIPSPAPGSVTSPRRLARRRGQPRRRPRVRGRRAHHSRPVLPAHAGHENHVRLTSGDRARRVGRARSRAAGYRAGQ
jgi:hypothetical protein